MSEDDLAVVHGVLDPLRGELGFDERGDRREHGEGLHRRRRHEDAPRRCRDHVRVLADNRINIEMISTSSIKISCVIEKQHTERAVRALHAAFQLDKESIQRDEMFG